MKFSNNDYIQDFIKQENLINPRIINRLIFQVNKTIDYLRRNETFYFLKEKIKTPLKETVIKRLESIEWELLCNKIRLITNHYSKNVLSNKTNKNIFEWILKNKDIYFENPNWERTLQDQQQSLYFYIEINNTIFPIWFSCLIPFLGHYINNTIDLGKIFNIIKYPFKDMNVINAIDYEIKTRNYELSNRIKWEVGQIVISISTKALIIPNHLKSFLNILVKNFDIKIFISIEFKITFDIIKILIENSIFDY